MNAPSPLVLLLQLAQRARQAGSVEELCFVMVNETHALTPYRQAVLWQADGTVAALSGLPVVDGQAPFVLWLRQVFAPLRQAPGDSPLRMAGHAAPDDLKEGWGEWLPDQALALPLRHGETLYGWLLLARDAPFEEAEIELLDHLTGAYAHAWGYRLEGHRPHGWRRWRSSRRLGWWVAGGGVLLLALPVPLTVLAPAEIVPTRPEVVRAPMEGVVERFHVQPNARVAVGQPLFDLDDTTLRSRLEVAEKSLAIAESEYLITSQLALQDPRSKTQLALLAGRAEEKRLEAEGLRDLLVRSRVKAARPGIALFSDPQSWIGRPVVTGERILTVAQEQEAEVEAWLSPGDLIPLPPAATLTLFLNVDPLHPRQARVRLVAYEATARSDGTAAHQLRATLEGDEKPPRLGLKGIARVEGERVTLLWWMVRRPVAMVRQWLGW